MKKGMVIAYPEYDGLYLNITNRCPCACTFCIRKGDEFNNVDTLWLEREPTIEEVEQAIEAEDLSKYKEIVFCGYGEPTERLDVILAVSDFIKQRCSLPVRINTNGLGELINGKKIAHLLEGRIDAISISLNSSDPEIYEKTVRPIFKEKAFPALLSFARDAAKYVPKVVLSTVSTTITAEDEEKCRKICEELGVTYRIRQYIEPKKNEK